MTLEQQIAAMPLTERIELLYYYATPDQRYLSKYNKILDKLDQLNSDLFEDMFKKTKSNYTMSSKTSGMAILNMIMNPQVSEKSDEKNMGMRIAENSTYGSHPFYESADKTITVNKPSDKLDPETLQIIQLLDCENDEAGLYVTDNPDTGAVEKIIQGVFASLDVDGLEETDDFDGDIQVEADNQLAEHHRIYRVYSTNVHVEEI